LEGSGTHEEQKRKLGILGQRELVNELCEVPLAVGRRRGRGTND
jgi:hypothetical protein